MNVINECEITKQITTTYFKTLTKLEKLEYLENEYEIVNFIKPVEYLPYNIIENEVRENYEIEIEKYQLSNLEDFIIKIKKNPTKLNFALERIFNDEVYSITINNWSIEEIIKTTGGGNGGGKRTVPQQKNSVSQQKLHSKNTEEMCVGVKFTKKGQQNPHRCIWKKQKNSCYCSRHNEKVATKRDFPTITTQPNWVFDPLYQGDKSEQPVITTVLNPPTPEPTPEPTPQPTPEPTPEPTPTPTPEKTPPSSPVIKPKVKVKKTTKKPKTTKVEK
jgi:hypothetical protein